MPNVLFASNNIAHWPNAVAGSVPGTYDSNRVPYSIAMSNYETLNSPSFTPSSGDDTWFHFRLFSDDIDTNLGNTLFTCRDSNGNTLLTLTKRPLNYSMSIRATLTDGASNLTDDSSISLTLGKIGFIDVQYTVTPLLIQVRVYMNGSLALTLAFNANPNNFVAPSDFSIGCAFTDELTDVQHVSEIIVADGDTRNARLDLLRPASNGASQDWSGLVSTLSDDDPTTGMTTITAGHRQTVGLTPYAGAENVSNVVVVSQTTRGLNSPTKMGHVVRLSGVNYDTPDIDIGYSLQYNITDYQTNPATSAAWLGTDLGLIETGFVSVA